MLETIHWLDISCVFGMARMALAHRGVVFGMPTVAVTKWHIFKNIHLYSEKSLLIFNEIRILPIFHKSQFLFGRIVYFFAIVPDKVMLVIMQVITTCLMFNSLREACDPEVSLPLTDVKLKIVVLILWQRGAPLKNRFSVLSYCCNWRCSVIYLWWF